MFVKQTKLFRPPALPVDDSMIIEGDALYAVGRLPSDFFQCVVTSPPYWGLRDYAIEGQIGLEPTLDQFLSHLVTIFSEIKRVLRDDGTLWLNIGDSYTSGNRGYRAPDKKNPARTMSVRPDTPTGLKPKDLIGVPWRLALELQKHGWYLRSDIVWNKPNAMPESVKEAHRDRIYPTMYQRGAHYVIDSVAEMMPCLDDIEARLARGEKP